MEDIRIDKNGEKIMYESKEKHSEDTLLTKYQEQFMALKIQEHQESKAPMIIENIKVYITFSEESIKLNESKQSQLQGIFSELEININKRIQKIKEKYSDEELMKKAKELVNDQKTIIEKDGDKFIYKTEVSQSVEDLLIGFMHLQEEMPSLIEKLAKQKEELKKREEQLKKIGQIKKDVIERLDSIKEFFKKQNKDVDKLLDNRSQKRNKKQRIAQNLNIKENQ